MFPIKLLAVTVACVVLSAPARACDAPPIHDTMPTATKDAKRLAVIRDASFDADEVASLLAKLTQAGTVVGSVPFTNAILLHATADELAETRVILKPMCETFPAKAEPEPRIHEPKMPGVGEPRATMPRLVEPTYLLNMRNVQWEDVLGWYATTIGLKPGPGAKPEGQFSFTPAAPRQKFTAAEITDILNDALMKQKMLLLRRHKTFVVVSTEKKIDPTLAPRIEMSELPKWGRTELVQVVLGLPGIVFADIEPEAKKLLGPFGSVFSTSSNLIVVQDTAGNVARLKKLIDSLSAPEK